MLFVVLAVVCGLAALSMFVVSFGSFREVLDHHGKGDYSSTGKHFRNQAGSVSFVFLVLGGLLSFGSYSLAFV